MRCLLDCMFRKKISIQNNINKNVIVTNYDPTNPCRRSTRLKKYDYSQAGVYFIPLVIKNRNNLFGDIKNGDMIVNDAGKNTERCWFEIPNHYQNTQLYEYIVMLNHFHGIIKIVGTESIPTLGSIICGFKIGVTKCFQKKSLKDYPIGKSIWQRNYWEHVIRNETKYKYIA
ncbi:MAG: hypothetical protein WCS73_11940 [Lentisphaeria bacterium]